MMRCFGHGIAGVVISQHGMVLTVEHVLSSQSPQMGKSVIRIGRACRVDFACWFSHDREY